MSDARSRDAFFEDRRAFVGHRGDQASPDLVVGEAARRDALCGALGVDDALQRPDPARALPVA